MKKTIYGNSVQYVLLVYIFVVGEATKLNVASCLDTSVGGSNHIVM